MTGANNGSNGNGNGAARVGTSTVKQGLAQMLKGGVIVSRVSEGIIDFFRRTSDRRQVPPLNFPSKWF